MRCRCAQIRATTCDSCGRRTPDVAGQPPMCAFCRELAALLNVTPAGAGTPSSPAGVTTTPSTNRGDGTA